MFRRSVTIADDCRAVHRINKVPRVATSGSRPSDDGCVAPQKWTAVAPNPVTDHRFYLKYANSSPPAPISSSVVNARYSGVNALIESYLRQTLVEKAGFKREKL
jgi:hypothetical protein